MADDPGRNDGAPPEDEVPEDAVPDGNAPMARELRRRPNLRGHIVVDDDEPLDVFDAPADPPPAPPDSQASPG